MTDSSREEPRGGSGRTWCMWQSMPGWPRAEVCKNGAGILQRGERLPQKGAPLMRHGGETGAPRRFQHQLRRNRLSAEAISAVWNSDWRVLKNGVGVVSKWFSPRE